MVLNSTRMICQTPSIILESDSEQINAENGFEIDYGFIMDNVQGVRSLKSKNGPFILFPNPEYIKFEEDDHVSMIHLMSNLTQLNCGQLVSQSRNLRNCPQIFLSP